MFYDAGKVSGAFYHDLLNGGAGGTERGITTGIATDVNGAVAPPLPPLLRFGSYNIGGRGATNPFGGGGGRPGVVGRGRSGAVWGGRSRLCS